MIAMKQVLSIRDLVNLWPSRSALADDMTRLAKKRSVSIHQVNKWAVTGSIPAKYHYQFLQAAQGRNLPVTADVLVRLHAAEDAA